MSRRRQYDPNESQADRVVGQFRLGQLIPLHGCWLRVAAVEPGVLVLALDSYTPRGQEILDELRAKMTAEMTPAPEEKALA